MRNVMLSIFVMLAMLAGIPATACWYLDPTSPAMTAFASPPQKVLPATVTVEESIDPVTGAKVVKTVTDEGDYRFTLIYTTYIDPITGVETTIYDEICERFTYQNPPYNTIPRGWETVSGVHTFVFDPATGSTTVSSNVQTSLYHQIKLADGSTMWITTSGQKTSSDKVYEGVRWVDIGGGVTTSDRSISWENVETTKQTVTETIVPVLDPDTGQPVLDPETGEPMTDSVYSDPTTETTTIVKEQTSTVDPENGVTDSTNTSTTVVVINPSTGTSETTTTTEDTTTTTDPETGSTETTTETETINPDGTTVTETGTKNETVTYDDYEAPIVNWWENTVRTEPYDIVTINVSTSVDPLTGVTTITTTTTTEHWDGYSWNTTTDTQTQTIPPAPLLTKINHVAVKFEPDPTAYSTPKTDAPLNVLVRARYFGDYTLHCFEADPSTDGDGNPLWSYSWMPAKNTLRRVNGKYQSPQLMLFGRGLYPNLTRERNNAFWQDGKEFILSISTSADSLTAWREMMDCCGGVNCKFGRHKRFKLSNVAKPGK